VLRRAPGFTAAAIVALAVGIGATTAIFSALDRVVLRQLPYADPDRLAMVWDIDGAKGLSHERLSPVTFLDYRALSHVFEDAAGWWYPQVNLTEVGKDPMRVNAVETSGNFFSVIGVRPILGPGFPASTFNSRDRIAVISHRLWRDRFGSDPDMVGKTIVLSDNQYIVAGVMPFGFTFPNDTDVWQRLQWDFAQHSRGAHFVESLFRLKTGVTMETANRELRSLTTRLGKEFAATNADWSARAVPLAHEVQGYFRPALFALFGAAVFLLLITCTNVAGLLLARGTARQREVAVRAAIGASRGRLVRQFVTESVILSVAGTTAGVVVAIASLDLLTATSPIAVPRLDGVGLDGRVLAFAALAACVSAIAFGVVPAVLMARGDVQRPLQETGRGTDGGRARARARSVLVTIQVALAVVLLVGAGLLVRSFQRLVTQDPGFRPERIVSVNLELPFRYEDFRKIADFYSLLLTSIRQQPGVADAGLVNFLPLTPGWRLPFQIDGRPRPRDADAPQAQHQSVDDDYFKIVGVPLLSGRFFESRDTADAPGVVLINEALARREWPRESPLGQHITTGVRFIGPMGTVLKPPDSRYEIVGVVADMKNASLASAPEPAIYFTYRQFSFRGFNLLVKGQGDANALAVAARSAVARLDPNIPLSSAVPLANVLTEATSRPRALMALMAVFAALALGLSALGIYSVLAYTVSQRRQELSVRMALGAQPRDLLLLVVREGMWLTVIGAAVGAAAAMALGRTLSTLLYGVHANDVSVFAAALGVAHLTALLACWLPARRAARLKPIDGLRV
jgi:predicted permease